MKTTSNMKASVMKSIFLALALIATISTAVHAQTYRPATNTKLILNSTYPSGNALTLQTGAGQAAYTLTLPANAPTAGFVLQSDPSNANTLIWTSPLGLYDFQNGLTESGSNTVKWGGDLTGATTINTADYALIFANNGSGSSALTIGGGSATLTLDVRGATTINTNGSASTSIGNANATFTLVSSTGLNVTSAGVISDGNGEVLIEDDVLPNANDQYSLGSNTARWKDIFVGPSTLHIGSSSAELAISYNANSGKAIFNVGSNDILEVTSAQTTSLKPVSITDATTSTTSSTGALRVSGGVGIGENVNVGGNASITGTLGVTGATVLNGGLTMDTDKFTVADVTGNTSIGGTLAVTNATSLNGNVTLGSDNTDVITAYLPATGSGSDEIVLANSNVLRKASVSNVIGTSAWMIGGNTFTGGGATRKIGMSSTNGDGFAIMTENTDRLTITSAGAATFSGSLTSSGNFTVGTNRVTINATDGTTMINGTLDVSSATTISGLAVLNAGLSMDTDKFTVQDNTGNTAIAGTLNVTGDVAINTNKFTVAATSGNTAVAGTLNVTGDVAVNTNKFTVAGTSGNTAIAGTLGVTDAASFNGNVTLGNANTDVITAYLPATGAASDQIVLANSDVLRKASVATVIGSSAWMIGGNTFTGGGATRKIGMSSTNGDGFAIMTENTDRLTITSAGAATFSGSLSSTGDFAVNTNKFTVAASSGNTEVAGTLGVSGAATLSDALTVTGETNLNGGLKMDTDKFTVADGSGNTTIGGTLAVTGATTLGPTTIDALTSNAGSYASIQGGVFELYRQSAANTNKSSLVFGSGATADGKIVLASRKTSDATTISLELDNNTAKLGNTVFNTYVDQDPVNGFVQIIADNTSVKVDQTSITLDGPTSVTNTLDVAGSTTIDALSNDEGSYAVFGTSAFEIFRQQGAGGHDSKSSLEFGSGGNADGRVYLESRTNVVANTSSKTIALTLEDGQATLGSTAFNTYVDRDPANGYVQIAADFNIVKVDLNGVSVSGVTTFNNSMNVPISVQTGAYTATDADYIIIQDGNGAVTLPAGVAGRVYIIKNTYTANINVNCQIADDFEDGTDILALGIGASAKLVYSGGVWYQVGN